MDLYYKLLINKQLLTSIGAQKKVCDDLSLLKLLSACQCLTSLFGMGRGVSTELLSQTNNIKPIIS